jgi:hypothetical protein
MKAMPITAKFFMKNYCEGNYSKCARNYLFTYMEKNLLSMDDKTKDVIAKLSDTLYPDQLRMVEKALPS